MHVKYGGALWRQQQRCLFMSLAGLESKGKLRGKAKAQKKKEEREKKISVKTPGDDLKDNLADNDDSSSTTTETSNPDVEANIKEVPVIPLITRSINGGFN